MLSLFLIAATIVAVFAQDDDLRTRLIGFDGCDQSQVDAIRTGWRDSWQVMDTIREINVNWNEAAAVEFLGPPGYNQGRRATIQDILHSLGTITGRGVPFPPLDWRVHVRCDDWKFECPSAADKTEAYTTNEDQNNIATINFCPRFFRKATLSAVIANARRLNDRRYTFNLANYDDTTSFIIVHELLHINWVHKSGRYGPNEQVIDYRIEFWDENERRFKIRDVYGPQRAKILARYNRPSEIGRIIARSDENLGLYALAKFVQAKFGAYPHLPLVNTQPNGRPWVPLRDSLFLINGTGGIVANSSVPDDKTILVDYLPEDKSSFIIDKFFPDSDLPADYIAAWKGWSLDGVGLTNLHINNFGTGWIRTSAVSESSGTRDVAVKKGDTVGVFDGWVTYWTDECPGATATFVWEESYGDVFLAADGYMHDSGGARIGQIPFDCAKAS
ncbi:MAG: hypothetical protein M1840_007845 [Geoglossum simile]|nr:MAG: hypothetical protein M1840_007845 [Geoglossum simile]